MATDISFVEFVKDQIKEAGSIVVKKMFGEYGIYCDDIFFGVICNNSLFIKPTQEGRIFIGNPIESPPYEGAKPSFLIGDKIEDSKWISQLVKITIQNLPEPKKKNK